MRHRKSLGVQAISSVLVGLLASQAWAAPPTDSPAPAAAPAGKPRLVVVAFALDDSDRAAAKLSAVAERIASELGRHELIDLAGALDPEGLQADQSKVDRSMAMLAKARQSYDELELKRAKDQCDTAVTALEKSDMSRNFGALVQARMLRIASLIANAETGAADAELEELLPTDLQTPFDANLFAPDFIARAKRRRVELTSSANLGLDVEARPVPARVYVDGVYRGVSSVELRDLTAGDHVLTLVAPGYKVLQKQVRPGAGKTLIETLEPAAGLAAYTDTVRRIEADFRGKGRDRGARELARAFGAEEVLVIGVQSKDKDRLEVLGVRVAARDGHELAYVDEPLPNDEKRFEGAADQLLRRTLTVDLPRDDGEAVSTTGGGFEWRARHTGYVLLGLAAVAIGAGVYYGMDARNRSDDYAALKLPQTDPAYQTYEDNGRRSALIADVSYLTAIIAGGTGLFLAITGRGVGEDVGGLSIEEQKRVSRSPRVEDENVAPAPAVRDSPRASPKRDEAKPAPAREDEETRAPPRKASATKGGGDDEGERDEAPAKSRGSGDEDDLRDW